MTEPVEANHPVAHIRGIASTDQETAQQRAELIVVPEMLENDQHNPHSPDP